MRTIDRSANSHSWQTAVGNSRRTVSVFGAALALIALTAAAAAAEPITYIWNGNGTGSVDGSSFTNADYTITCVGDTTTIAVHTPQVLKNLCACTMDIDGAGSATITESVGIFVSTAGPVVGFWHYEGNDYLSFADPTFAGWDLAMPMGPVSGIVPGAPTQFAGVASNLGPITLSSTNPISFEATTPCPPTPDVLCENAFEASLSMKGDALDSTRQKLKWRFKKSGSADLADFGDPVSVGTNSYTLCLYDDATPVSQFRFAALGTCGTKPCWSSNGTTTTSYRNKTTNQDGISAVKFKVGSDTSQILVSAKGAGLNLPFPIADTDSMIVELRRYYTDSSSCWQTTLPAPPKSNDPVKLKFSDSQK